MTADDRKEITRPMDFKLELVVLPVSDVDRARDFYVEKAGFTLDVDHRAGDSNGWLVQEVGHVERST